MSGQIPVRLPLSDRQAAALGCSACGKPMKTGPHGVLIHADASAGHEDFPALREVAGKLDTLKEK